jgi:hypothetical protein
MPTAPKIPIHTRRMLQLISELTFGKKTTQTKVYEMIGAARNNHTNYQKGLVKFTVDQMINAAKLANVSLDWICGLTNDRSTHRDIDPLEKIKQGVLEIEASRKTK